jgi:hypothetical protein
MVETGLFDLSCVGYVELLLELIWERGLGFVSSVVYSL